MAAKSQPALSILLVGKTGVGKSATGNSLLGRPEFEANVGESVTKQCKEATATRDGVQITVIDTPGICDTDGLDAAKVIDDYITTEKCELHAICLVINTSRPTAEEKQAIAKLCKLFGMALLQYLFIVITTAENLEREKMKPKDFLKRFVTPETDILHICIQKDRVFGIDNFNDEKKKQQIQELLEKVNTMVSENKGAMYTLHILEQNKAKLEKEAKRIKEEEENIQRKKEEQRKQEIELEKEKAKKEERQKLQKEREALEKEEEVVEELKKQLAERLKQHNDNADRMDWLEKVTIGAFAGITGIGTSAASAIGITIAIPVLSAAAAPFVLIGVPAVLSVAAAVAGGALMYKLLSS